MNLKGVVESLKVDKADSELSCNKKKKKNNNKWTKVSKKMKKANIKARIKKEELNPVFHFKDKEEDDKILTKAVIKAALKSGKIELSGKNLKYGKQK